MFFRFFHTSSFPLVEVEEDQQKEDIFGVICAPILVGGGGGGVRRGFKLRFLGVFYVIEYLYFHLQRRPQKH